MGDAVPWRVGDRGLPKRPFLQWLRDRRSSGLSNNEIAALAEGEGLCAATIARKLHRIEHERSQALEPDFAERVLIGVDHGATMLYDLWPARYGWNRRRQAA